MLPVQKPGAPCPPREDVPTAYVASRAPRRRSIHDRSMDFDEEDELLELQKKAIAIMEPNTYIAQSPLNGQVYFVNENQIDSLSPSISIAVKFFNWLRHRFPAAAQNIEIE